MSTDEHTPVSMPPRTKEQRRADFWVRIFSKAIGPIMAAVVAIALGYIQRSSDLANIDKKSENTIQSVKPSTDKLTKELGEVKSQLADVAAAGAANAKLTVENHEDAPPTRARRRRARAANADPDLVKQVQDSVGKLQKVEAKAKAPLVVPVVPDKVPDQPPTPEKRDGGGGAATPNPPR